MLLEIINNHYSKLNEHAEENFKKFYNLPFNPVNFTQKLKDDGIMPNIPKTPIHEYIKDGFQRNILWLDTLRKRGNIQAEMSSDPNKNVLHFDATLVMDGKDFKKPINYYLLKVTPPKDKPTDPLKRPFVIADPRAGQSPGIGGFKNNSEIGDAVNNGHPTYLLGFRTIPEDGQTYEDILIGQAKFFEYVKSEHPNAPDLCAIGNCAAGYPTMITASLNPKLFGPIIIAGSPVSYWNGTKGKFPMRYTGGLLGGSWLTALTGDVGNGKFDGAWLVLNFDLLNPDNFFWEKQYDVIANVDSDSTRYLDFERWWGDFCIMNKEEIMYIVNNFFIGNHLTEGTLKTKNGDAIDLRNIESPIVILGSTADNISPPGQSVSWVADLYHDVDEMKALGKTVVYILSDHYGHLAQFVSTAVGKREDEAMVEDIIGIDLLPPGLYELVVEDPKTLNNGEKLQSRFEKRTLDDLRKLGINSKEDDRAFSAISKASNMGLTMYEKFLSPFVRMFSNDKTAEYLRAMHPLRLSYTMFSDRYNPFIKYITPIADKVKEQRVFIDNQNTYLEKQDFFSNLINDSLKTLGDVRDNISEEMFWAFWGNSYIQSLFGVDESETRNVPPAYSPKTKSLIESYSQKMEKIMANKDERILFLRGIALIVGIENLGNPKTLQSIKDFLLPIFQSHNYKLNDIRNALREQFELINHNYEDVLKEWKNSIQNNPIIINELKKLSEKLNVDKDILIGLKAENKQTITEKSRKTKIQKVKEVNISKPEDYKVVVLEKKSKKTK